jgi:tRNA threonylcarbamoyl adenosine modification protein (Sua5/YciO/YrdC/YwlC family)
MRKIPPSSITTAIKILDSGQILAIPTETVFGLAIKHDHPKAIAALTALKNRSPSSGKIFTLMLSHPNEIKSFVSIPPTAQKYLALFPAELTLILPKNPSLTHPYFDHFTTVGIRIPNHTNTLKLLAAAGPLIVTSANLRGEPPATTSKQIEFLLPQIPATITGTSGQHLPSTVLDLTAPSPKILRQGTLTIPLPTTPTQLNRSENVHD